MSNIVNPAVFVDGVHQTSEGPIVTYVGGKGFDADGALVVGDPPAVYYVNGLPFNADGALVINPSPVAPYVGLNGILFDSTGAIPAVSAESAVPPLTSFGGVIFDANGAIVVSVGGGGTPVDPEFDNVALLLHYDGADGSIIFTDSSVNNAGTLTTGGVTISTAQSVFGGSSGLYTGASIGLRFNDISAYTVGAGDFTLELWARFDTTGLQRFLFGQADGTGTNASCPFSLQRTATGRLRAIAFSGASIVADITGTTVLSLNTWYYIALTRSGSTFTLWLNAVSEGTASSAATLNDSTQNLGVGILGGMAVNQHDGYIDELRFTVGFCRDIAAIGVPTEPFPDSGGDSFSSGFDEGFS